MLLQWVTGAAIVTTIAQWIVLVIVLRRKHLGSYTADALDRSTIAFHQVTTALERNTEVVWQVHQAIELDKIADRLVDMRHRLEETQRSIDESRDSQERSA